MKRSQGTSSKPRKVKAAVLINRSQSMSPASSSDPEESEILRKGLLDNRFVLPQWAARVGLQSQPLPEGREFSTLVTAIMNVHKQKNIKKGKPVNMSAVATELYKLDPDILTRYNTRWQLLLPLCQVYIAVQIVLPPLRRELKQCNEEILL